MMCDQGPGRATVEKDGADEGNGYRDSNRIQQLDCPPQRNTLRYIAFQPT